MRVDEEERARVGSRTDFNMGGVAGEEWRGKARGMAMRRERHPALFNQNSTCGRLRTATTTPSNAGLPPSSFRLPVLSVVCQCDQRPRRRATLVAASSCAQCPPTTDPRRASTNIHRLCSLGVAIPHRPASQAQLGITTRRVGWANRVVEQQKIRLHSTAGYIYEHRYVMYAMLTNVCTEHRMTAPFGDSAIYK